MKVNHKSRGEQRVVAARKRMEDLVGKANLGTDDPLMAEIQMAQLDALLAIAHVMLDLEGQIEIKVQTPSRDEALRSLVRGQCEMGKDIEDLKVLVHEMYSDQLPKRPAPVPSSVPQEYRSPERPWWQFWE